MNAVLPALQAIPELTPVSIGTTIVVVLLAVFAARLLFSIAVRVAVVAAIVAGLLWYFGLFQLLPF
ncbi:hypothetical protein DM867_01805 [Halosegnis rubeus]|jgi:hypothetical protein|uniref:Uncharacterized protein n=1 Tax=Halosegnis rubeus TaxID=2212850 RepID=A0A5N5UM37_9EURY|nr:hypothetical protein [Halosegnis rubeus]KAB7515901.1 hypothetical protein DM867_01805 [Halosegnis rubeus]KAB7516884.1 hypothetical protein DMP03_05840 [Halosegnis rubeus]KAB7519987.1 hypothetical protein DP108_01690 [Halosegnis rubeus]